MTPSQATTRPKVRATISSDYVTIVLQTLSETSTIRPEVASLLANDAEYYLRHLINLSKHHMRHAKRSRLSVSDVQLAAKRSPGALPGFGISSSAPVPNFQPIPSCHGLFVTSDIVVPLVDVLHRPLPLPPRPTDLFPSGLIIPYANLNILSQLSQQYVCLNHFIFFKGFVSLVLLPCRIESVSVSVSLTRTIPLALPLATYRCDVTQKRF